MSARIARDQGGEAVELGSHTKSKELCLTESLLKVQFLNAGHESGEEKELPRR